LTVIDVVSAEANWMTLSVQIPGVCIACWILRMAFMAAAVTEKCVRLPSLVNSLNFVQDQMQNSSFSTKHYLIEYIIHSAAGFYVFDVRLTTSMALKAAHLGCVVAFGLATKILTSRC